MLSILLVDDEPINYKLLKNFLSMQKEVDLKLDYAGDAKAAFKKLHNNTYDLLFVDINLPIISGFELAKSVKDSSKFGGMEMVAITAYGKSDFEDMLKENDCANIFYKVIFKPVDVYLILSVCKEIETNKK